MERVELETRVEESYRVRYACDMFGFSQGQGGVMRQVIEGEVPGVEEDWRVGVIVGPSGSGKSCFARGVIRPGGAIEGVMAEAGGWPREGSVMDGFGRELSAEEVVGALTVAGLGGTRDWVKPWCVLSGGQQARAELARALMSGAECVGVDEFTSTLDRETAQIVALASAKAVRSGKMRAKRMVAVTCHEDVLPWLEADWVLEMPSGRLTRGRLCRPGIVVEVRSCSRRLWGGFAEHHYLSGDLSPVARCYAACHGGEAVGFCATVAAMGSDRRRRLVHRLVVLPRWQGVGVGRALLEAVADVETADGPLSLVTSHPGLARALKGDARWRARRGASEARVQQGMRKRLGRAYMGHGRVTISFETNGERRVWGLGRGG
jgi:energy-coupling factor transporter ATP-binding protein EcfA2